MCVGQGETAIQYAFADNNLEVVKALLSHGADASTNNMVCSLIMPCECTLFVMQHPSPVNLHVPLLAFVMCLLLGDANPLQSQAAGDASSACSCFQEMCVVFACS